MFLNAISCRTVTNIKLKCKGIIAQADENDFALTAKNIRPEAYLDVNEDILQLISMATMMQCSIRQAVLMHLVLFIHGRLLK